MTNTPERADIEGILRILDEGVSSETGSSLFDPAGELVIARAPGRIDLMGGIADYSGSLVLQWPTREATLAAAQATDDGFVEVISGSIAGESERRFRIAIDELLGFDYAGAEAYFRANEDHHWAAYVAGAILVLNRETGLRPPRGLRLLVVSNLPEGKGVSSSAAVEVASMLATASALDVSTGPIRLALLCQVVENRIAGAPCGIMDQMTSACGRAGKLLALLCQPAEIQGYVDLPENLEIWGIDSGIRHAVSGSDYATVRTASLMGRHIVETTLEANAAPGGYLASIPPSVFESRYAAALPTVITGSEFLRKYGDPGPSAGHIDPATEYSVLAATAHPIYEHHRVNLFRRVIESGATDSAVLLGELMYQSHVSYSRCGLGSTGTNRLVEYARELGPERGIYGAKITGGGSGGTVAILARRQSEAAIRELADMYASSTGVQPYLFSGTSPGAAAFGIVRAVHANGRWHTAA